MIDERTEGITCDSCGGSGKTWAFVDGVRDGKRFGERRLTPCHKCAGEGSITPEHQARIAEGERRREDRKSRNMTLWEEAKRLGISPVKLSDIEWGRTEASR